MSKICKGVGKGFGFGCGIELPFVSRNGIKSYKSKYGLGLICGCFSDWLLNSNQGAETLKKSINVAKKKVAKNQRKKRKELKDELNSSDAMKLADMYFSRYIRVKYSENGYCTCFTSGEIIPIKEIDNGHYMKREHKATRFHEDNCRPQSKTDNGDIKHNGKQVEFRANLIKEISLERVLEVERLSKTTIKTDAKFYRDIAKKYRLKLNELQKKLNVKYW